MDPNHWNTYNLPYGAAQGGLTPTHPSLGLSLSHGLQGTHGSISGRGMSAIPSVNYTGLSVPILETMAPLSTSIPSQQTHKSMAIGEAAQIVFDPQVRVSGEQLSPSLNRYDTGNKVLRTEGLSRSQLIEAARVWGGSNFTAPSSLYNQYSAILPDVTMPVSSASIASSPSVGNFSSSKSSQQILQEPPPAHSSSIVRITSCQRNQHMGDLIYSRASDSLNPVTNLSLSYSSSLGKDLHGSSQQQTGLHHRQTQSQTLQGYLTPHRETESLPSAAQHQLYGSYGNLATVDSQDFSAQQQHISAGDLSYEAVSPAAPVEQENTTPAHMETTAFSLAQFPEFANLAPEHAQALVDKYHENDFRLKLDPMRGQQVTAHSALSFNQGGGHRQDLKANKDGTNIIQSMHMNQQQQSSPFPHIQPNVNIAHSSSPHHPPHSVALTLSSMQQIQTQPTVQAPADSTTKPKRVRNRKKKGETSAASTTATPVTNAKKSVSHTSVENVQRHHNIANLHMPPSSQFSTLPLAHSPHITRDSQQQQQQIFPPVNSHFTSRDAHRAQTPSMPQNYSLTEQQGYSHSPSPKIQTNPSVLMSPDFSMSSRVINEKSSTYKQARKPKDNSPSPNVNTNQNNQSLYITNIPDNNQMTVQGYSNSNLLMNLSSHADSPLRGNNNNSSSGNSHRGSGGHISRLGSYPSMPGQHQHQNTMDVVNMNHQSPQDSKLHTSTGHCLGNTGIINLQQQSVSDTRQSNSSQSQSPLDLQQQPVVMSQAPTVPNFENRGTAVIIDNHDPSNQFQVDFGGQPFLEQLVSAQNPNFGQSAPESEEVMMTTLVTPNEHATIQEEQTSNDTPFRPTYHGAAVHEIHPVGGSLCEGMSVSDLSSFQNNGYDSQSSMNQNQQSYADYDQVEVEPMTLTYMPSVAEDDEFNHFSSIEYAPVIKKEPQISFNHGAKKDNFQDSFLSYLQGNKQETLSSVSSSAITKKPQLPKYIPEPKRPKPATVTVLSKEPITIPDDSDDANFASAQGKDFLSTLSDNENSSQKSESDKEGYTVQRTSELAMKITLSKGKKKGKISTLGESALLSHNKKQYKEEKIKVKKQRGKLVDSDGEEFMPSGDEKFMETQPVKREPTPPPARTSIGRKAKDRCLEKSKKKRKYAESGSSSEDEIFTRKVGLDDKNYDSDKDPIWSPFDQDLKVGYDLVEKKKKTSTPKRVKLRAPIRAPPPSIPKPVGGDPVTTPPQTSSAKVVVQQHPASSKTSQSPAAQSQDEPTYQVGQYLIEKKDLQSYDNYPIWRLEQGNMIHKYELVFREGVVRHKAVGTYSTWMKPMYDLFQPIKVNELVVKGKSESVLVQVLEEFQPKMPTDGKLIQQYEDDPLVEPFNIYLQVFISQALEPTFLKAILDMGESFYLDPLNEIDNLVDKKVRKLAGVARWKPSFQEFLHRCPLMKEIDRPNLKQACQACENSSPPTIKSVLLSGQAYDRTLLTNIQTIGADTAQEFMIGKVAAQYVRPYHSLYHFKYWLRTRCEAKVKIMKESNKSVNLSGENILDKCLENRNWVLQLFDNFKKLLMFQGESAR